MVIESSLTENADRLPRLPPGWSASSVGELFDIKGGGTPSTNIPSFWQGSIPWITSSDIHGLKDITPRKNISLGAIEKSATHCVPKGSIIVVTRVGLGKIAIAPTDLCFSQDCQALINGWNNLVPEYCLYWLSEAVQSFKYRNRGTTISGVTVKQLHDLYFPLPPLPEQHRIVARIEELFTQLDAGIASLKKAQVQLKRYRQAVLKAAFEGRLTQAWREEHKGEIEPASFLIESIFEKNSPSTKGKSDLIPPLKKDDPLLPTQWEYATIAQISEKIVDCPHSTPKYGIGDAFCVDTTCIEPSKLIIEKLRRVDIDTFNKRNKRLIPQDGDVVFAREGSIGTAVVLPNNPLVCLGQRVMLIRPDKKMNNKYVCYAIMSPQIQNSYKSKILGSTVPHINVGDVINFKIPVSPRIEQEVIVSETERHFSQIDHLENTITTSLRQAEILRQSILKRAFEGKLVPQDPNDEPASVLLERIKAEKARRSAEGKKGKTLQRRSPKRRIKNAD